MKKTALVFFALLMTVAAFAQTVKEQKLYFTNFQDWTAVSSSTTASTKTVTTSKSNETLTFSFAETAIDPSGTNSKFTNTEVVTTGYAQSAKTATPYIETSALASITKVVFVQAATGGSRGWGLKVKGDGDADWVTVFSDFALQAGRRDTVAVNRTNCQLRFYNLADNQNGYLLELGIFGNVEVQPRTFTDFKVDFRTNPYTVIAPATGLPAGVVLTGTDNINGAQHGLNQGATITVPVDGPVKFTIGACNYNGGDVVVTDHTGAQIATIDAKKSCENSVGDIATAPYASFATWNYNVEASDTLKFTFSKAYLPYFFAEACDFVEDVTVTYFDQNGTKLGEVTLAPGTPFEAAYTVADLPAIPAGMAFRGWYNAEGIKAPATISDNINLYAKVTDVEVANVGTHYRYDLGKPSFYMEDHELIAATGKYHSNHGFVFGNGEEMTLIVSPKSYVSVGLCTYTNTSNQIIRNAAGDSIACMQVIKNGETGATADGAIYSFYNESAAQDTIHFQFTTTSYIHSVEVYNVAAPLAKVGHVYSVAAGDAATFMMVCKMVEAGDTIQLHDGLYDLGETVLTTISASNIVVRGESMTGTVIKNAPDAKLESINGTATLVNTGTDNVFENLTLQNALDYYKANNGRAVAFWDKGDRTACYNVRLLSYQDTYYSNKAGQQCWFEDCEIHGTVDYICGSGSVYFYNTLLYCEKRNSAGGGSDCITANSSQTARSDKGYVFDRCTIKSECPIVSLGRAWNDQPMTAYLLTTLDMSAGNFALTDGGKIMRWTKEGMNVCANDFSEYNTMDVDGNVISPASNELTFTHSTGNKTMETILSYEAAEAKSYVHFFRDGWSPARNYVAFPAPTALEQLQVNEVRKYMLDGQLIIEKDGVRYNAVGQIIR